MMAEHISKKRGREGWSAKVNDFIHEGLNTGDFTFPARVTTVSAVVRRSQPTASIVWTPS